MFRMFELNTCEDVRVMWSTFHRYITKGPIKVDVKLARSTNNILKTVKHPEPSINGDEMSS